MHAVNRKSTDEFVFSLPLLFPPALLLELADDDDDEDDDDEDDTPRRCVWMVRVMMGVEQTGRGNCDNCDLMIHNFPNPHGSVGRADDEKEFFF